MTLSFLIAPALHVLSFAPGVPTDRLTQPVSPEPVINGREAGRDELPMAGALLVRAVVELDGESSVVLSVNCSSSLIAPDVVLTAAHCVDPELFEAGGLEDVEFFWSREPDLFEYALEEEAVEARPVEIPEDAVSARGWVIHPDFDIEGQYQTGLGKISDLALVFLERPVDDVPLAYVPASDDLRVGVEATVAGWGVSLTDDALEALTEPFPYVGVKRTGVSPIAEVGPWEFVLGAMPSDPRQCVGDSGGPIFRGSNPDGQPHVFVIGVASRTYDDTLCESKGAVNTRVVAYREWIEQEMISACDDGLRSACESPGLPEPEAQDEDEMGGTGGADATNEHNDSEGGCSLGTPKRGGVWLALICMVGRMGRRRRAQC